jgi:hypothetical protein
MHVRDFNVRLTLLTLMMLTFMGVGALTEGNLEVKLPSYGRMQQQW